MQPTVVFLDMDGPMLSNRAMLAQLKFDPVSVAIVNRLLVMPGVLVVVSSTVRLLCSNQDEARARLAGYGLVRMTFHDQWRTGRSEPLRSNEVLHWLDLYREPGVQYIAIDDDPISIPDVTHISADYDGIGYIQLLRLKHLMGDVTAETLDSWNKWMANH